MADMSDVYDLALIESLERRPVRIFNRSSNDLEELSDFHFRQRYRFNKSTVEEIVSLVSAELSSSSQRNRAISPTDKVLAAIRFFSFNCRQINLGDLQHMSQPSSSRAIQEVAEALASLTTRFVFLPHTEEERMQVCQDFYQKFGFPGVYGALDCTLIKILNPGGDESETYRSRKGFFALNVQTLSDANLSIRNLVVRWQGSAHDSTIFDHSYLRAHLETEVPSRYHVLGDSGYPLRPYLLTPFLNPSDTSQTRYNAAHAKARNVVERQYGVWKRRFASISDPLRCSLENAKLIIMATAVLHNIAISMGDLFEADPLPEELDTINHQMNAAGIAKRNSIVQSYFS